MNLHDLSEKDLRAIVERPNSFSREFVDQAKKQLELYSKLRQQLNTNSTETPHSKKKFINSKSDVIALIIFILVIFVGMINIIIEDRESARQTKIMQKEFADKNAERIENDKLFAEIAEHARKESAEQERKYKESFHLVSHIPESTRKQIYIECLAAADRAQKDADTQCSLHPERDLKVGDSFITKGATSLCPVPTCDLPVSLDGKMRMYNGIKSVPEGEKLTISKVRNCGQTNYEPWYYVEGFYAGWINSLALVGQIEIDLDGHEGGAQNLEEDYINRVLKKHNIDQLQYEVIEIEGLQKEWGLEFYNIPKSLM